MEKGISNFPSVICISGFGKPFWILQFITAGKSAGYPGGGVGGYVHRNAIIDISRELAGHITFEAILWEDAYRRCSCFFGKLEIKFLNRVFGIGQHKKCCYHAIVTFYMEGGV